MRAYTRFTRTVSALALGAALSLGASVAPITASLPAYARGAPESFADLAASVSDAVVNISATQTVEARRGGKTAASELKTTFFSETILTRKTRF